jgi:hypothetical protein
MHMTICVADDAYLLDEHGSSSKGLFGLSGLSSLSGSEAMKQFLWFLSFKKEPGNWCNASSTSLNSFRTIHFATGLDSPVSSTGQA